MLQLCTYTSVLCTGNGPIVLDDVQCSGGEQSLLECNSSALLAHNCRHYEDAGVICPASELKCSKALGSVWYVRVCAYLCVRVCTRRVYIRNLEMTPSHF